LRDAYVPSSLPLEQIRLCCHDSRSAQASGMERLLSRSFLLRSACLQLLSSFPTHYRRAITAPGCYSINWRTMPLSLRKNQFAGSFVFVFYCNKKFKSQFLGVNIQLVRSAAVFECTVAFVRTLVFSSLSLRAVAAMPYAVASAMRASEALIALYVRAVRTLTLLRIMCVVLVTLCHYSENSFIRAAAQMVITLGWPLDSVH